jgi:hypothetical protein
MLIARIVSWDASSAAPSQPACGALIIRVPQQHVNGSIRGIFAGSPWCEADLAAAFRAGEVVAVLHR